MNPYALGGRPRRGGATPSIIDRALCSVLFALFMTKARTVRMIIRNHYLQFSTPTALSHAHSQ
eukprot:scaffold326175_cov54-Tisochrysis_lutea.AAC.1